MNINNYIKNGYLISNEIINANEIDIFREEINHEYKLVDQSKVNRKIIDFKNINLVRRILNLFKHHSIQIIINNINKKFNTQVAILPGFETHKNYHVNLKEFLGWHRDCGGELDYNYCQDLLYSDDYFFSKIGFYLQKNEDFGGSIDIIKTSHKNFSKKKIFFRKLKNIPLRFVMFFHKYLNKLYNLLPEKIFMFFLNAEKLKPNTGTAVFFDSRIIHRGSPIIKKNISKVEYVNGKYQAYLPEHLNKFSIYCHLGNSKGIDSYMFDRLKRKENSGELKSWINQIEILSQLDKELFVQTNLVLKPIKEKYKEYLI
jgi:hypothetical protein